MSPAFACAETTGEGTLPARGEIVRAAGMLWSEGRLAVARGYGPDRRSGSGGASRVDRWLSTFGGTCEPDEDADRAVLREVHEELDLLLDRSPRLLVSTYRPPTTTEPAKRSLLYDLGAIRPAALRRNPAEIAEIVWIDPHDSAELARMFPGDAARIQWAVGDDPKPVFRDLPPQHIGGES